MSNELYVVINGIEYIKKEVAPKPKTVMVEMLVEDAEYMRNRNHAPDRIAEACRKALENKND